MHADNQHIHVIVTSGSIPFDILYLRNENILIAFWYIKNISGGTIASCSSGAHPLSRILNSPVTCCQKYFPSTVSKCHGHGQIRIFRIATFREIAEIILKIVDTPLSKLLRVLKFMSIAARISGTGLKACT